MSDRDRYNRRGRRHRSGRPWQRVRRQVLERDGFRCQLRRPGCTGFADTVDHIVPLIVDQDQPLDPAGLRAACRHCNTSRGDGRDDPPVQSRRWL